MGKIAVEGRVDDRAVEEGEKETQGGGEGGCQTDVGTGDGEDVAKEIRREIGSVARREDDKDGPDSHAERPEGGDGGVFADTPGATHPLDPKGREDGERKGGPKRIQTEVEAEAETSEGGVGDATADEDESA